MNEVSLHYHSWHLTPPPGQCKLFHYSSPFYFSHLPPPPHTHTHKARLWISFKILKLNNSFENFTNDCLHFLQNNFSASTYQWVSYWRKLTCLHWSVKFEKPFWYLKNSENNILGGNFLWKNKIYNNSNQLCASLLWQ